MATSGDSCAEGFLREEQARLSPTTTSSSLRFHRPFFGNNLGPISPSCVTR